MMNVTEAVFSRTSIRSFLEDPVSDELLKTLLEKASRAASGGNLQPWKIFIVNNSAMKDFLEFQEGWTEHEVPAYEIYPPKLKEEERTKMLGLHKLWRTLDSLERPVLFFVM